MGSFHFEATPKNVDLDLHRFEAVVAVGSVEISFLVIVKAQDCKLQCKEHYAYNHKAVPLIYNIPVAKLHYSLGCPVQ